MDEPGQRMGEGALNAAGAVRPGGVTPTQVRGEGRGGRGRRQVEGGGGVQESTRTG